MRHVFLVNRIACDGEAGPFWESVQHHFREAFPDMEAIYPPDSDAGVKAAKEVADAGTETCVVTVGGEGTMNRALNGIISSDRYDNVSMALVPFGNVNDYASNIGLNKTWEHALETLKANKQARVGVIRVTTENKTEYALNIADIGFGATTAKSHSVDHQLSWIKGQLKYNLLAFKTLLRWKNVNASITIDDQVITDDIAILLAGFSRTLGGFHLVPQASPVSDQLAISYGLGPSKWQILGLIDKAKKNRLEEDDIIHFNKGSRISIEARDPMVVEVDGEIVSTGSREILFEAMPHALRFVVPPDSSLIEA
jgi:diacylglycerol kinase (ATP)